MSGVEAAGFILAAFPLLISALEHYRESAEVLEVWWKIKREYRKCKHELEHQKLLFEGNLEEFLLPLIVDEEELQALIADPGGTRWKNPYLDDTLKERLPKSYNLYLDTITEINEVMEELKRELGVDKVNFQNELAQYAEERDMKAGAGRNKAVSKANLEYQAQRFRFAFGQSSRNNLFDKLSDYNKRLRDLLSTQDRLTAVRSTGKKGKTQLSGRVLSQFWRRASSLFNLLAGAWQCECQISHRANLLLQHRITPAANFKILFLSNEDRGSQDPGPWSWQETQIKLVDDENQSIGIPVPTSPLTHTTSIELPKTIHKEPISMRSSILSRRPKRLSEAGPAGANLNLLSAPQTLQPKVAWLDAEQCFPSPTSAPHEKTAITDLCTTIATYRPGDSCFGVLKDEEACYTVYPLTEMPATFDPRETVTLEMLLHKQSEITLSRRQRYSIALTLASSHLQLYSSPWLTAQWSKKDIVFLRDKDFPDSVVADQPYISRDFAPSVPNSGPMFAHGDRSIFNLGIMLLELCFGVALEDHKLRPNFTHNGQSNPYLELAQAREWCSSACDEAGPEFADAIKWCLQMNSIEVKSKEGRERLFAEVVEPLQYCHDAMTKGTRLS